MIFVFALLLMHCRLYVHLAILKAAANGCYCIHHPCLEILQWCNINPSCNRCLLQILYRLHLQGICCVLFIKVKSMEVLNFKAGRLLRNCIKKIKNCKV